jgi:outer membrane receptor protein involved in Fe transport
VTSYEVGYKGQFGRRVFITLDAYDAHIENLLTGLLPAGTTGLNPDFKPWTAPPEVPAASRAEVEAAVLSALAALDRTGALPNGLTRLADRTTAVVLSYGNAGRVDEWGVELGGSVSLTRALTLNAGYTWYNFAIRQNLAGNVLAPNTPQHKGTAALAYAGRQGIAFGVDARIVSGYHWRSGIWDGDIPASQIVNLNAGYRIGPHLRVYADVTDVFDQRRFQVYGGAVIGRRVLAGVTSTF